MNIKESREMKQQLFEIQEKVIEASQFAKKHKLYFLHGKLEAMRDIIESTTEKSE